MQRFGLSEESRWRAFLAEAPRVVVLYRGVGCVYSSTFEKVFVEEPLPEGWVRALREVEEGGHGPIAEALDIDVTPTAAAIVQGKEVARLPGKLFLGIPRTSYRRWLTRALA